MLVKRIHDRKYYSLIPAIGGCLMAAGCSVQDSIQVGWLALAAIALDPGSIVVVISLPLAVLARLGWIDAR